MPGVLHNLHHIRALLVEMVLKKALAQIFVPWFVHSNRYQWIFVIRHVVLLLHHSIIVIHSGRIGPAIPSFPNHVLDEGFVEIVLIYNMAGTLQLHGEQRGLKIAGHGSTHTSEYGDKVHVFGNGVVGLACSGIELLGRQSRNGSVGADRTVFNSFAKPRP